MSIWVLLSGIFFCSCSLLFSDDEFALKRVNYTGNQLKTNGYYYKYADRNRTFIYFLYRNGIILCAPNIFSTQNLDEIEKEMVNAYKDFRN
jgi:hypothetical protein